jgi:hypothetical protein
MGWELKTTPVSMPATRELAREFAEMTPAPHDRALSKRRLDIYEKLVEARQFRPVTWARAWCLETQDWYRVNGKHTSVLLSERFKTIPRGFHVIVENYECDTLEDVARLYATFDSKTQSRTANDIYVSFAHVNPQLREMSSRFIQSLVSGVGYHTWGEDYWAKQPADRAEEILDHVPFCLWCREMFDQKERDYRHLTRQAVIAAMLGSWLRSVDKATAFWGLVRDESGPEPTTGDRVLAKWLFTSKIKGRAVKSGAVTVREMYVRCIQGWNAWRRGEKTVLRYYPDKEVPNFV